MDSVYIILTLLPDITFFLNVIENIHNTIKLEKLERFGMNESIQDLDLYFFRVNLKYDTYSDFFCRK